MSIAEALCPHTLSIFAAPPVGSQPQPKPFREMSRTELEHRLRHVNEVDDQERRRCFGVLEDGMHAVIRHLEDGDAAAALEAARTALSEIDPITASAVLPAGEGEGGEGR